MARVSNWAKCPRGYEMARFVGAYPETKFNRNDTAIAFTITEGDKVLRLEVVLTAEEQAKLVNQLRNSMGPEAFEAAVAGVKS